jgi:hypothetical protein
MLFDSTLVERIGRIPWLARVSIRESISAGSWPTEQLMDYADSRALMQAWYVEGNRALGDLQHFFFKNAPEHDASWNEYIEEANAVIRTNVRPHSRAALQAGNYEKLHCNLVADDVKIALIEIQFRHLGTPRFFENLLEVYEAGHLPCGWRGMSPSGEAERRELAASYFSTGTLLYW